MEINEIVEKIEKKIEECISELKDYWVGAFAPESQCRQLVDKVIIALETQIDELAFDRTMDLVVYLARKDYAFSLYLLAIDILKYISTIQTLNHMDLFQLVKKMS